MSERAPSRDLFDLCGTTIADKYRVTSVVGSGGFGVVYRGVHTGFGEPIAVKCLKLPSELGPEQQDKLLTRLQDEGRVLHRLSRLSSGIVQALDVGAVTTPKGQWVPFLVLEWLEGQTLAEYAKDRHAAGQPGMSLVEAIELLEPAARALAVAHQQKVAHRDVKPENLVLTEVSGQRTMKVLDFGIAKVLAHHSEFTAAPAATQKGATAFTPHYGAPEQFNKKRGATGPWTDVFALALILIELVSGERALDGDDATQLYIAAADPSARPTLRYRGVETSDAVERILQHALAVDPHDRFPDAGTFWDELREAAGQQPSPPSMPIDQSETGEFVSRHAMGIEPDELSKLDDALAVRQPQSEDADTEALTQPKTPRTTERERSNSAASSTQRSIEPPTAVEQGNAPATPGGALLDEPLEAAASDGAPPATDPPDEPGRSGTERAARGGASTRPAAGVESSTLSSGRSSRSRLSETGPPSSASGRRSSWWMTVIALAALAGAGLLYAKLRQEQNDDNSSGTSSGVGRQRPRPGLRGGHGPTDQGGADGGSNASGAGGGSSDLDGGLLDGTADADGAAGAGGAAPPEPPEGMVYVPPVERDGGGSPGFFIDQTEVTTRAYRDCVLAGRCVRASRVVLTEEVANRLWGLNDQDGDQPSKTPERLAEAWGKRCNEVRGELDHPINCVNHASAADFCRWRDARLPTAAEWRRAAGGAPPRAYPWGDAAPQCGQVCFGLNGSCLNASEQVATCAVAEHPFDRTPAGAFDMGGNVAEWVADQVPAPASHLPPHRMALGGAFTDEAGRLASSTETALPAVTAYVTIGLRCAKNAPVTESDD